MAEILKIFKLSKSGKVAGSKVTEGEIKNNSKARILRDGKVVHDGSIASIFREKNAVKEVKNGLECGISFKNFAFLGLFSINFIFVLIFLSFINNYKG